MGEAWRRRLFRRVKPVRFAVAIAAAERERRNSSQRDIEMLSNHHTSENVQTIHNPQQQRKRTSDVTRMWAAG